MKYAIQISGLRKNYGSTEVLKGIDFQVKKGEIFGILGVNGAGKTTTLECIEGFRGYDSGEISVDGKIGIQLQSASLPAYIKAGEAVSLFAKWNHAKTDPARLSALGIPELERKRYMELSTGQKRRLHLALALTGDPDILFLDEPTAGLDVEGRVSLHKEIFRLKEQGRTIVMASHDMTEVENLCSRIAILNGGKIAFCGTTEELAEKLGRHYDIRVVTEQGEDAYCVEDIGEELTKILEEYKEKKMKVLDLKVNRGTLEQHFIRLTKGA